MDLKNSKLGWMLALAGFLLLIFLGKVSLLVVVLPTAGFLAYGLRRSNAKSGLTANAKKS